MLYLEKLDGDENRECGRESGYMTLANVGARGTGQCGYTVYDFK